MNRLRHSIRFAAIIFCCTLMTGACRGEHAVKRPPQAIAGTLDLRTWEFGADGPVDLSGDYEFYWQRLLAPGAG